MGPPIKPRPRRGALARLQRSEGGGSGEGWGEREEDGWGVRRGTGRNILQLKLKLNLIIWRTDEAGGVDGGGRRNCLQRTHMAPTRTDTDAETCTGRRLAPTLKPGTRRNQPKRGLFERSDALEACTPAKTPQPHRPLTSNTRLKYTTPIYPRSTRFLPGFYPPQGVHEV